MLNIIFKQLLNKIHHILKIQVISSVKAGETVSGNSHLTSLAVKLFYKNIPNFERIKAVKLSLDNLPKNKIATKVITTFLLLILTISNFVFNCNNYAQTKGCAMGTICAPCHANIFLDHFKKYKYLYFYKDVH